MTNTSAKKGDSSGNKEKIAIDKKGSLGLLALGHKGLIAWRKVRNKNDKNAKA